MRLNLKTVIMKSYSDYTLSKLKKCKCHFSYKIKFEISDKKYWPFGVFTFFNFTVISKNEWKNLIIIISKSFNCFFKWKTHIFFKQISSLKSSQQVIEENMFVWLAFATFAWLAVATYAWLAVAMFTWLAGATYAWLAVATSCGWLASVAGWHLAAVAWLGAGRQVPARHTQLDLEPWF